MNSELPEILQFFGRLHTVVLHLPIGILILASILEMASRFKAYEKLKPAIPFVLFWGMIAAIITAGFGYLLSQEGGYDGDAIWNHKWLGIATAVVSTGIYFFRNSKNLYLALLTGGVILLGLTGHTGGSLTHGSEFLFEPFEDKDSKAVFVGNIKEVKVFNQLIRPIFKSKCNSCHNSGKVKGGLILTDTIAIKKGGDNGVLFIAQQAENSLLLQRIHLPEEVDEHMPPKGKKQLSDEEIKLLQWWISGKAEFVKTVADYPSDPEIEALLKDKFIKKKSGIATVKISPVSSSKIESIHKQGLKVFPLGNESPWLEARLSDRKQLSKSDFKTIQKVAENITILDLGNTSLDKNLIQNINNFPNLSKLFLDQTNIDDETFQKINPLPYLEYLNLYACDISDQSIEHLKKFKELKSLYLWQTKISDEGINDLKNTFPKLNIINGKEMLATFANAQLRPPKIKSDSTMFTNQITVNLDLRFPWAKIFYTLDGSAPDSTSLLYADSILISKTTTIKTIAKADGWKDSKIAEETFISVKKRAKKITINTPPNSTYNGNGEGEKILSDLRLGTTNFKDGKWLAWQGKSVSAIMDFGTPTEMSSVFVSALDNNGSWIFFPKGIKVWTSDNGKNYKQVATKQFPTPTEQNPASLRKIETAFEKTTTRFLKVQIDNLGKNPAWHPSPGQPSWLFVDEILIR